MHCAVATIVFPQPLLLVILTADSSWCVNVLHAATISTVLWLSACRAMCYKEHFILQHSLSCDTRLLDPTHERMWYRFDVEAAIESNCLLNHILDNVGTNLIFLLHHSTVIYEAEARTREMFLDERWNILLWSMFYGKRKEIYNFWLEVCIGSRYLLGYHLHTLFKALFSACPGFPFDIKPYHSQSKHVLHSPTQPRGAVFPCTCKVKDPHLLRICCLWKNYF